MRRLKHHCKRLKIFSTTPESRFRDQGGRRFNFVPVGWTLREEPGSWFSGVWLSRDRYWEVLVLYLKRPRVKIDRSDAL